MQKQLFSGKLTAASIDRMSEMIVQAQESLSADARDIQRIRLTAEEVLGIWAEELGEDTDCELLESTRFKKTTFILRAAGRSVDPTQYRDDLLFSVTSLPNLMAALRLSAEYNYIGYIGGRNELHIPVPARRRSSISTMLIAIVAGVLVGLLLRQLLHENALPLSEQIIIPLMNTVTGILSLIAGPLMLLSIISGILGIGDASSFSRIGGSLVKRFIIMTFFFAALIWLSVLWLFPVSFTGGTSGSAAISDIIQMILNIVPRDIVSPFQTGNAMQIIFIAICFGIACILLGDAVPNIASFAHQMNAIVQKIMTWVNEVLPVFVFLCLINLILVSDPASIYQIFVPFLLIVAVDILMPLIYGLYASVTVGIPFGRLLKLQLPTYLLALTTASSSAAFYSNVECCTKKLHIDEKLVNLGVPLGQVVFKIGSLTTLVLLSLFMAKQNGIAMTPQWVATMLIIAPILAVATPPIPGGGISATLILFSQLGIPTSCMAICATILTFTDYTVTSCSIACLQQELLVSAKKQGLLYFNKEA